MPKTTTEKRVAKANKRVSKALFVFENAANELDTAADDYFVTEAELLNAADAAEAAAKSLRESAELSFEKGCVHEAQAEAIRTFSFVA